jgi:hypothetical protein
MPTFTIKTPLKVAADLKSSTETTLTVDAPDAETAKRMAVNFLKTREDPFIPYCERNLLNPADELFIEAAVDLGPPQRIGWEMRPGEEIDFVVHRSRKERSGHGMMAEPWTAAMLEVAKKAAEARETADPAAGLRRQLQFYKTMAFVLLFLCAAMVAMIVILS